MSMLAGPRLTVQAAWFVTASIWIAKGFRAKRTERSQDSGPRGLHVAVVALAAVLVAFGPDWPLYQATAGLQWTSAALVVAGCLFAICARLQLGANWSPHAAIKSGHDLVQHGAYAWSRHPIYTGILTALAGTALAMGQTGAWAAFCLLATSFHFKTNAEEAFMESRFGANYIAYRRRVRRLIPLIWSLTLA